MRERTHSYLASILTISIGVGLVAFLGSKFSQRGEWYEDLNKPPFQPPNWVFPVVWNLIFLLAIVSLVLIWNTRPRTMRTWCLIWIAILNGSMNVAWSALFFKRHMIYAAAWDAGLICISVIAMILLSWRISRIAALLFVPYAIWTAFATYLTWVIGRLNT